MWSRRCNISSCMGTGTTAATEVNGLGVIGLCLLGMNVVGLWLLATFAFARHCTGGKHFQSRPFLLAHTLECLTHGLLVVSGHEDMPRLERSELGLKLHFR
jgi:hypothetical protein